MSLAGVCGAVRRVHAEQKRGEAVQSVQERLSYGHQRVTAQVPVQTGGDRAADLWKQSEILPPTPPHISVFKEVHQCLKVSLFVPRCRTWTS